MTTTMPSGDRSRDPNHHPTRIPTAGADHLVEALRADVEHAGGPKVLYFRAADGGPPRFRQADIAKACRGERGRVLLEVMVALLWVGDGLPRFTAAIDALSQWRDRAGRASPSANAGAAADVSHVDLLHECGRATEQLARDRAHGGRINEPATLTALSRLAGAAARTWAAVRTGIREQIRAGGPRAAFG